MTNDELTELVNQISLTYFNQPFTHKAYWNSRLRTTGGRFFPKDKHLDFNPKMTVNRLDFKKIILHELCHYHLYLQHKGYKHQDRDFKNLLAEVGGSRYAPQLTPQRINYLYECSRCGQQYPRLRKIDLKRMRCGKCRAPLILLEKRSRTKV